MKIHHVGYYVQDIKRARNIFSMMGFDEESEQIYDEERGINVLFLTLNCNPRFHTRYLG